MSSATGSTVLMKSIVFKITLAVSVLVLAAVVAVTCFSGGRMSELFNEYMMEAAKLNDPYPVLEGGRIIAGPAEKGFLNAVYSELVWIGLPIMILAFLASYIIAMGYTLPIRKLNRGALEIASGNFDQRVDIGPGGELGTLARSFNFMAGELARTQALRKQFFADAAHELKTPIAVIKGNIEGMMDGVIPTDKNTLQSLLEEADFLNDMIGDIKYLAMADSGQLELGKQIVDVNGIVSACVKRLMPAAEGRGLSVTTQFKNEPLTALIDPERFTQVVYNLLINAGKYTPHGGSITVTTEKMTKGGIENFKVTVQDTGVGISEEDIPHVFDRFYRADKSRDRKTGGIGLGLAIVKKLVELHGGRVGVTSELGKGSCFYVVIPNDPRLKPSRAGPRLKPSRAGLIGGGNDRGEYHA